MENELAEAVAILVMLEDDNCTEEIEEDAYEHCLATWAAARGTIQAQKLARLFPKGEPDTAKSRKRVKCWNCGGMGHTRAECKKPRKSTQPMARKPYPGKGGGGKNFFAEEVTDMNLFRRSWIWSNSVMPTVR